MRITVNGKPEEVSQPVTVDQYLSMRGLKPDRVVVEHNRKILDRQDFPSTSLSQGDVLEIVHFVGGG